MKHPSTLLERAPKYLFSNLAKFESDTSEGSEDIVFTKFKIS